ncbi:MAG: sulfatase [Acidobacteriota bacterium]|nr:sulfatase [Acidobacteriota bacterium]
MRILFLDIDTLRPDHLGCYGYARDTSPNIDWIASQGTRFDNYYCSDAPCLPSRGALVTGQFGIRSGIVGHGATAADMRLEGRDRGFRSAFSNTSLWQCFRNQGLRTVSISPFAERHSAWWFNAGFLEMVNTGKGGMESAEEITPSVLDWIDRNGAGDDWMLHVNYWDPHTPYRAPEQFGNPFSEDPLPTWLTEELLQEHRSQPGGHGAREVNMWDDRTWPQYPRHMGEIANMRDWRRMIDGYDCGIRYVDGHVGQLLSRLDELGVLEDTAIIVTSDHGENLGELNCYGEHGTSDQITHRIPMIVRWPGCKAGHVDRGLHYNLDLAPTLADLYGVQAAPRWQGASYAAALRDGVDCGRDNLVLSQCCHGAMRSVRFGPWIYIRVIHDFMHLYPREMLFNIEDDPHEVNDLAQKRPDICDQGARIMLNWHEDMMMQMPDAIDPLWTVMREGGPLHSRGHLDAYCERLAATERGQYVAELRRRHPDG